MREDTVKVFEEAFRSILENEDSVGEYAVMVPTTDDWEFPLPSSISGIKLMRIDITQWTREGSYVSGDGLFVKTAFGEEENSKLFPFWEIMAVINDQNEVIIAKPYVGKNPDANKSYTLKGLIGMQEQDDPGLQKSMDAFKKNNPPKEK